MSAEPGISHKRQWIRNYAERLEARVGIEPTYKGFADLSLTTWVPRPSIKLALPEENVHRLGNSLGCTGLSIGCPCRVLARCFGIRAWYLNPERELQAGRYGLNLRET